jgi:sporulation protein YlmC with PRC-barrel domain
MENDMKLTHILVLASVAMTAPTTSYAQIAGSTLLGVSYGEMRALTTGWSATRTILGQPVFNENNERVGKVDDLIVSSDKQVTYAIVNAGGFLAVAKHDIAVPVSSFQLVDGKLVLAGATKDALKQLPPFEYAN